MQKNIRKLLSIGLTAAALAVTNFASASTDLSGKSWSEIEELAKKDKGIIMISSEMPELLGVTDRILVMSNGRVAGIVETAKTSQEEILQLAAKYL